MTQQVVKNMATGITEAFVAAYEGGSLKKWLERATNLDGQRNCRSCGERSSKEIARWVDGGHAIPIGVFLLTGSKTCKRKEKFSGSI